ncbi:MAG: hypothetical protein V4527_18900 [Pseudomonadota bacterium]
MIFTAEVDEGFSPANPKPPGFFVWRSDNYRAPAVHERPAGRGDDHPFEVYNTHCRTLERAINYGIKRRAFEADTARKLLAAYDAAPAVGELVS